MTAPKPAVDQAWGMLAESTEAERAAKMMARYRELAALPDAERVDRMLAMARAEYDLADAKLRPFTLSRLQTWIRLEPSAAKQISAAYDAAMLKMPGPQAMRRVALVQSVSREMSAADELKLRDLIPGVLGAVPPRAAIDQVRDELREPATPGPSSKPAKKGGWWPFGKK